MRTIYNAPLYWTTYDGKQIPVSQMEQGHLSNVYWFFRIIHEVTLQWALDEIERRFNGRILPYTPLHQFEIEFLENNGLLKWRTHLEHDVVEHGDIFLFGQQIGGLTRPLKPKEEPKPTVTITIEHSDSIRIIIIQ